MNFEAFNLNEYIDALEQFKRENAEEVVKYWGSVEAVSYTHLDVYKRQPRNRK